MAQDGLKDHPGILWWMRRQRVLGCSRMGQGCPRMVLRIILGFLGGCGMSKFQEAPGWPRMVLRIILGFCGGCGVREYQDAPGWPSMVLGIILGFFDGCSMSKFQEAPGWPRMVLRIILGFCGGCGVSEHQDAPGWMNYGPGWPSLSSSYLAFAFDVNPLQAAPATKDTKKFSLAF